MKQFIDNLISRLEERKKEWTAKGIEFSFAGGTTIVDERAFGTGSGLYEAIGIVNQLAEEYKGGWIPCSDRLPEKNDSVLCWAKSTARGGDVCFVGSCHNGFWFLQSSADTHTFPGQYVVVAWKPIEPYRKEGE